MPAGVDAPGLVFSIGSVTIVVTLLPRNDTSVKSPHVAVIELFGIPGAGTITDVVVLTSVLSWRNMGHEFCAHTSLRLT